MRTRVVLVNIADTQIHGVVARTDVNGAFVKLAEETRFYSGILDGHFNDAEEAGSAFTAVVENLCSRVPAAAQSTLYVGVPHEFCRIECEEQDIELGHSVKLNTKHTNRVRAGSKLHFDEGVTLLAREVVYYSASEYKMYTDIRGATANSVTAFHTIVGATDEFLNAVPQSAVSKYGFRNVKFVPLPSAELFLIPESVRDGGCTMIRNDFFTTSIVHVLGDCATYISTYNVGIGRIIDEIMESFSITYEMAAKLLSICTPTINAATNDNYIVNRRSFPCQIVNKLVKKSLTEIGKALADEEMATAVYHSGERIDEMFGAANIISNEIGAMLQPATDVLTRVNPHPETTINALLRYITR